MKVKELIDKLSIMPPEAEVEIVSGYYPYLSDVSSVALCDDLGRRKEELSRMGITEKESKIKVALYMED